MASSRNGSVSQKLSYHPLRMEKGFSKIFASKTLLLLNIWLMSPTNTYKNINLPENWSLQTVMITQNMHDETRVTARSLTFWVPWCNTSVTALICIADVANSKCPLLVTVNATSSGQSLNFTCKKLLPTSAGKKEQQCAGTHKRSCIFPMINRGRLELATSPICMETECFGPFWTPSGTYKSKISAGKTKVPMTLRTLVALMLLSD